MSDDLKKLLETSGLQPGTWGTIPEHQTVVQPLQQHQEALLKLRALLEGLVAQDQATVARLREQIDKLKYGGGS